MNSLSNTPALIKPPRKISCNLHDIGPKTFDVYKLIDTIDCDVLNDKAEFYMIILKEVMKMCEYLEEKEFNLWKFQV